MNIILDSQGNIVAADQQIVRATALSEKALKKRCIDTIFVSHDPKSISVTKANSLFRRAHFRQLTVGEYHLVLKNRRDVSFLYSLELYKNPTNKLVTACFSPLSTGIPNLTQSDVSGDRVLEAEHRERAFNEFLGHHLLNAVTTIEEPIEALLKGIPLTQDQQVQVHAIKTIVMNLTELIKNALDIAPLNPFSYVVQEEDFDVKQLVSTIVMAVTSLAGQKKNTLSLDIDPSAPQYITGDVQIVHAIIVHLISNAFEHTENGDIKISLCPQGQLLDISVSDTGSGIPEDRRIDLFKPVNEESGSKQSLFHSLKLAKLVQGTLSVIHGTVAQPGTTFVLTIPCEGSSRRASMNSESISFDTSPSFAVEARKDTEFKQLHILVVEDEAMIQKILRRHLEGLGYRVSVASNGQEGCEAVSAMAERTDDCFNFIITDIQMPTMNGLDFMKQMQSEKCAIPMIVCSGNATEEDIKTYLDAGAKSILRKPAKQSELDEVLKKLVNGITYDRSPRL